MATKEKTTMKKGDVNEVYNILSRTTTEGLEGENVTTMLVLTSKLRRIGEDNNSLIKGVDEQRPKELRDIEDLPKDINGRNRIVLLQNNWQDKKERAINALMSEHVEIDTHLFNQSDILKFLEKQSELKITEKATLLDCLSK